MEAEAVIEEQAISRMTLLIISADCNKKHLLFSDLFLSCPMKTLTSLLTDLESGGTLLHFTTCVNNKASEP